MTSDERAFTWKEVVIVIVVLVLLAAIAIPNLVHPRDSSPNPCINYLRLIDSSKQQWALEQRRQNTDTPQGSDLLPYLSHGPKPELPTCPVDPSNTFATSYTINNVATKPTCKILPTLHILP